MAKILKKIADKVLDTTPRNMIKGVKNKVVDVTSDVLSAPSRYKSFKKQRQAEWDLSDIKLVREKKNVIDGGDYRDPLFRARMRVATLKPSQDYENEYAQKRAKANK